MNQRQSPTPAETYERYLSRAIVDLWSRVLLEYAEPQAGDFLSSATLPYWLA